ncbi:MAG: hemolysin family protein [Desulfobulbaceae bacterium]|nr:hemolysin family protein [Desulfobulbaceae bacterium]
MDSGPPEQSESSQDRNIWQRVRTFLRFNRQLDTTKELEQEIQDLLEEGEEQGLIGDLEERLINSIFDFRQTLASEIMTPSAEMVCAEETATTAELIRLITDEGYTRIPIYRDNKDHIVGILHAKDLLRICAVDPEKPAGLSEFINPPYFINESKPITKLLLEFQANKSHMAIVTDEFGGVRGLVTLEDVIEEIVGDIDDEHDQDESELQVIDENTIFVNAKIDIEEVENHFGCTLPEGPYESVGGLIIRQLGRVPQNGATITIDPLVFKVVAADRRRIKHVRIRKF